MSGEYNNESNYEGGCSAFAWQLGDLTVVCDSRASCHMSYSSTGLMNYRESNAYMQTVSGARYTQSRVMVTYPSLFDLVLVLYLCCFGM